MIEIIFLTFAMIALLGFLGVGLTALVLPESEQKSWWAISFWVGTVFVALTGTMLSQAGLSVNQSASLIVGVSLVLAELARRKHLLKWRLTKLDYLIVALTVVTLMTQLFTHLTRTQFPTTVSMGNLDPISYTTVADYLRDHTVWDGASYIPYSPYTWSVGDLLHYGYRWGTPMVLSVVSSILGRDAYEIYSLLLTAFFAMSYPILYLFLKKLRPTVSWIESVILFLSYSVNSILMYMLYNVFFGQFAWGGVLILSAWALSLPRRGSEWISALMIAGTALLYPEGLVFVILPAVILLRGKALLLATLMAPYPLFTGVRQLIRVIVSSSNVTWIGWEKIRYSNLLEILGLYNLNYSRPLPILLTLIPLIIIAGIMIYGFFRSKNRLTLLIYFGVFAVAYFTTRVIGKNFFTYWRALAYSIFLYSALWASGIGWLHEKMGRKNWIILIILVGIAGLTGRSAVRTAKQMYYHHHTVDQALISLKEMPIQNTPILTTDVILGEYNLWIRLWREYMLVKQPIITRQNMVQDIIDGESYPLLLVEQEKIEEVKKKVEFKKIIWDNDYYELWEINN
mgnify:CR=1 FL=1